MKKIAVYAAALLIFAFCAAEARATSLNTVPLQRGVTVTDRNVTGSQDELKIEGNLPVISGMTNAGFQTELNSLIRQEYTDRLETAKKDTAKKISFAHEFKEYDEYYSIVLRISTTAVTTREEVRTFVWGSSDKLLTVNDVLGLNGVKIINKVIADEIAKKPGTYNPDFESISEEQSFYVDNGSVFAVFDKYAIGSAALGTPEFEVNIEGVRGNTFTIMKSDSYPKDPFNVKMIPLRVVATGLGFGLTWEPNTLSIDVARDNATVASLVIGKNIYFKNKYPSYSLEFAPELNEDGVTYLPISFFERILDACYTVDQAGSITFSYYEPPKA